MSLVFSLMLLVFGAFSFSTDKNQGRNQRNFWEAVRAGRLDVVKSLAEKVDLNRVDEYKCSPVLVAAYEGHTEIVKFLADKVDLERANGYGRTPVWIAAWKGHTEIVQFLADKVDLNRANKYGHPPVWIAAKKGHTKIVKFLIGKKVDLDEEIMDLIENLDNSE